MHDNFPDQDRAPGTPPSLELTAGDPIAAVVPIGTPNSVPEGWILSDESNEVTDRYPYVYFDSRHDMGVAWLTLTVGRILVRNMAELRNENPGARAAVAVNRLGHVVIGVFPEGVQFAQVDEEHELLGVRVAVNTVMVAPGLYDMEEGRFIPAGDNDVLHDLTSPIKDMPPEAPIA